MIKSLLNADEELLPKAEPFTEEKIADLPLSEDIAKTPEIEQIAQPSESLNMFEIPEEARFFAKPAETPLEIEQIQPVIFEDETPTVEVSENDLPFIRNLPVNEETIPQISTPENFEPPIVENLDSATKSAETPITEISEPTIFQSSYTPETPDETIRNSGLAYSAAIVLFASVVFMMMMGWFVGQLIGNSTGGIVGGIILGAVIGFIQFFRITSSIFKK